MNAARIRSRKLNFHSFFGSFSSFEHAKMLNLVLLLLGKAKRQNKNHTG
jgi:hypothetical protein